jgi:hypothetical protein
LGEAQKSRDEQPDIGVMVAHDLAGAATFTMLKGAPPINEVDVLRGDSRGAGFRGSTAAKRTTDAIGVVDTCGGRDQGWLRFLNTLKTVEQVEFDVLSS